MSLDILIAGCGIGGLAAAIGLTKRGHKVVLIEQANELSQAGAAIGMAPNATGCLSRLGLHDRLEDTAVNPRAWTRRRWADGSFIGGYRAEGVLERFGHPFWMLHRADLYNAMIDLAFKSGASSQRPVVHLGMRVVAVHSEAGVSEVETATGKRFRADLVIGADGVRSKIRESLFGADQPIFSGNAVVRVQLPMQDLMERPDFQPFADGHGIETWMGPGAHIVHTAIRAGALFNFAVCFNDEASGPETWFSRGSKDRVLEIMAGWYDPLLRIVESGELVGRWDLYDREPLAKWSSGTTCLLGDAAHPMLPYLGQGAAQTLEDAVVLTNLLEGVSRSDIPSVLERYEMLRKPRAQKVQRLARMKRDLYHLPDGPVQQQRDSEIAQGRGDLCDYNWIWQLPSEGF